MDAIKKKMVAMKMEKENALDRAEQLEQKLRETEEAKIKVKYAHCFVIFSHTFRENRDPTYNEDCGHFELVIFLYVCIFDT